ncbi:hypothetical protein [Polynucleobacter necessarius]|uniref:hypothetical protein n=1 Tax=Polynucleobacter necessarius TaxID=576610 RepID=UPI000E0912E7|nr:hypothetical protein [Polynucleobacter necessarius]HAT39629.1 hypothetical protein [Polynucleobacter sp.]
MPHITVEIPPTLEGQLDWKALFKNLHLIKLAHADFVRLDDFKNRVVALEDWQVSDKPEDAIFLFATLHTMNPRPQEMIRAMGVMIHKSLEEKARKIANGRWLQVFHITISK